jgi:hypothetical protein
MYMQSIGNYLWFGVICDISDMKISWNRMFLKERGFCNMVIWKGTEVKHGYVSGFWWIRKRSKTEDFLR